VPTGIKTGVSTVPRAVRMTPALARVVEDWAIISKLNMFTQLNCL
jgi:hypothetical protein